jgi:putative membrane fusion protein
MQMESHISSYVDELIGFSAENDFLKLSEYKYKISMITAQKAIARGEQALTPAEEVLTLQARKNQIESELGASSNIISADTAGIFIEGKDGFEETLSAENFESFTPDIINDVVKNSKNGNMINDGKIYTYKIVDNFKYSVAVNLENEMTDGLKVGDGVDIRFPDFSKGNIRAVVTYISEPDEDGIRTVVAECDNYVKNLLAQRVVNVDFVKKSVSGYKVKIEDIHTVDNTIGVFVKRGAVMRFLPVNIEYSNEEEAIITSANQKMPIKSYDEIVKSAPEFSDGKVIASQ